MKSNSYIDYHDVISGYSIHHKNMKPPMLPWLTAIINFVKQQAVLSIAIVAMLITCIFVPVDARYINYFNWRTIATLFCTLAVVAAFSHINVFEILSKRIVIKLHNLRNATLGLVMITFVGSMLLANDMALLTFLF